jgi:uncharacterized protein (TIGR02145 family)
MKKIILLIFTSFIGLTFTRAQFGISSDGSAPDSSAILDVKSTTRGVLIPRMTFEERDEIQNPAEGLMVYCTNGTASGTGILSVYAGGTWKSFREYCIKPNAPEEGIHDPLGTQITWVWDPVTNATGYKWNRVENDKTAYDMGTNTGGTETGLTCGTTYTRYVWAYNDCGISISRALTQATISIPAMPAPDIPVAGSDRITWKWHPVDDAWAYYMNSVNDFETAFYGCSGDTAYTETGLNCGTAYTRYLWSVNECGISAPQTLTQSTTFEILAQSPSPGAHIPGSEQITWYWTTVPGATGYKWNNASDYATATDTGTDTTYTETGLTCGTNYTRYVWAYAACELSEPVTLTQATTECGGYCLPFIDSRDGKSYSTVIIGTQCWLGQNLNTGTRIDHTVTSSDNSILEKYCYNDQESNCDVYGGLYNRQEMMQYVTTPGTQGVCPAGWHIPTNIEWTTLSTYLGGYSVAGGKMKEAGTAHWISPNTGATNESGFTALPGGESESWGFNNLGYFAYFWSSDNCDTPPGYFYMLEYYSDDFWEYCGTPMEEGNFSVRCIKD